LLKLKLLVLPAREGPRAEGRWLDWEVLVDRVPRRCREKKKKKKKKNPHHGTLMLLDHRSNCLALPLGPLTLRWM